MPSYTPCERLIPFIIAGQVVGFVGLFVFESALLTVGGFSVMFGLIFYMLYAIRPS